MLVVIINICERFICIPIVATNVVNNLNILFETTITLLLLEVLNRNVKIKIFMLLLINIYLKICIICLCTLSVDIFTYK
jgi:hypothetical protein